MRIRRAVQLLGATLVLAAGCSGSSEPAAKDLQTTGSPSVDAGADRTETDTETETEGEPAAEALDGGDGDYSAVSGTWTGDLIWTFHGMDASSGSPYHAELQIGQDAEPQIGEDAERGSPIGRLVERPAAGGEVTCTWTVFAWTASAPTYEVSVREGSPAPDCEAASIKLEWDEEGDVLVVDGRWPKGSWDGELTRAVGS